MEMSKVKPNSPIGRSSHQLLSELTAVPPPDVDSASLHAPSTKCAACKNSIHGLTVQAFKKTWHPEHFVCHHCKKPIKGSKFYKNKDKPYCEADYEMLFLKKCSGCDQPIRDMLRLQPRYWKVKVRLQARLSDLLKVVVEVLNQFWHRDHFVCSTCGMNLAHRGFCERDNKAYCEPCFETRFAAKCKACDLPLMGLTVMALSNKWHQQCFKCKRCLKPITESTFDVINDDAVCAQCVQIMQQQM